MSEKLIEVKNLKKYFPTKKGLLHAVDGVNLFVDQGETLGLVGESGCGKSTIGRLSIRLLEATEGEILFEGKDIRKADKKQMKALRKDLQMVFQDPYSSLDPRRSVYESIAEPLKIQNLYPDSKERKEHVFRLMEVVGLAERLANSYPHELDGGRRQRIGVARAIATDPKFIVLDEPVSALDVSIQAQIINLLQNLQQSKGYTYLFISHDLSVVKHISSRIAVMYLGSLVELADRKTMFKNPVHPYTQALLSAVPIPKRHFVANRIVLEGDVPSPINPKPGCRFAGRCRYCMQQCKEQMPPLREIEPGHYTACWLTETKA